MRPPAAERFNLRSSSRSEMAGLKLLIFASSRTGSRALKVRLNVSSNSSGAFRSPH